MVLLQNLMKIGSEFISFYKVIWWGFPAWSNLTLENELKGVDCLLGMSSLAPLHGHPRGCLHGSLEAAAVPDGLRDLPVTSEGLPRVEQERIPSKVLHILTVLNFPLPTLFWELYNLSSQIRNRLQTSNLSSLSDTIYWTWVKNINTLILPYWHSIGELC